MDDNRDPLNEASMSDVAAESVVSVRPLSTSPAHGLVNTEANNAASVESLLDGRGKVQGFSRLTLDSSAPPTTTERCKLEDFTR